jgi:hypothetical protein
MDPIDEFIKNRSSAAPTNRAASLDLNVKRPHTQEAPASGDPISQFISSHGGTDTISKSVPQPSTPAPVSQPPVSLLDSIRSKLGNFAKDNPKYLLAGIPGVGPSIISSGIGSEVVSQIEAAKQRLAAKYANPPTTPTDIALDKYRQEALAQPVDLGNGTPADKLKSDNALNSAELLDTSRKIPVIGGLVRAIFGQNQAGLRGIGKGDGFWEQAVEGGAVGVLWGDLLQHWNQDTKSKEWQYTKNLTDSGMPAPEANKNAKIFVAGGNPSLDSIGILRTAGYWKAANTALEALDVAGPLAGAAKAAKASTPVRQAIVSAMQEGNAGKIRSILEPVVPQLKGTKQLDDIAVSLSAMRDPLKIERAIGDAYRGAKEEALRTEAQTAGSSITRGITPESASILRTAANDAVSGSQEVNRLSNADIIGQEIKAGSIDLKATPESTISVYKLAETKKGLNLGEHVTLNKDIKGAGEEVLAKVDDFVRQPDGTFIYAPKSATGIGQKASLEAIHAGERAGIVSTEQATRLAESNAARKVTAEAHKAEIIAAREANKPFKLAEENIIKAKKSAKEAQEAHIIEKKVTIESHPLSKAAVKLEKIASEKLSKAKDTFSKYKDIVKNVKVKGESELKASDKLSNAEKTLKREQALLESEKRKIDVRKTLTREEKRAAKRELISKSQPKIDTIQSAIQKHKERYIKEVARREASTSRVLESAKKVERNYHEAKLAHNEAKTGVSSAKRLANEAKVEKVAAARQEIIRTTSEVKKSIAEHKALMIAHAKDNLKEAKQAVRSSATSTEKILANEGVAKAENGVVKAEKTAQQATNDIKTESYFNRVIDEVAEINKHYASELLPHEYSEATNAGRLKSASELVANDEAKAIRIAKGMEDPGELSRNAVAIVLNSVAKERGDAKLMIEIAEPISQVARKAGQENQILSLLGTNDPLRAMSEVLRAREDALLRQGINISEKIKSYVKNGEEILKDASIDMNKVIDEITCK